MNEKKGRAIALLPIGVFLVLYLGLGIIFEYVMKIPMGFYNVPIIVAFLAAILVACIQNRELVFDKKLEIMAQGVGDKNLPGSGFVCRGSRKKQRRECSIFYVDTDPGKIFSSGFVCCCLLCISCYGHFGWNDHIVNTDCCSSVESVWL